MGRVYKALVRAENWNDGDRSIGRPHRKDSARDGDAGSLLLFGVPSELPPRSPSEHNLLGIEGRVAPAVTGASFGTKLADATTATSVPSAAAPPMRRSLFEPPLSSESVIPFEEPIDVWNFLELAVDPRVASLINENPVPVERYRALSVKLLNLAERRKLKTLLITSAEAREGKTLVATVVAWFLAKHPERRVLLIDANSSSPSVGRTLGLNTRRGWLNLIDGSCEPKHAIGRVDPNGLYVMTPGSVTAPQSTDAMTSRLENVIARLTPRFDLVVVDSSAILDSPETQRLAAVLDGAVIVARAGYTHHSNVTAARRHVPKERRLGVVLNESEAVAGFANRRRGKGSLMGRLFGTKR